MTTPTPDLAELRRLAEAATPGPWHAATGAALQTDAGDDVTHVWYCRWRDERFLSISKVLDNELDQTTPEDAAFIAAANPAVMLALLDAAAFLDEVRAQVARGALCPMCSTGMTRQTVGMVCQLCGTDYGSPEYLARLDALEADR